MGFLGLLFLIPSNNQGGKKSSIDGFQKERTCFVAMIESYEEDYQKVYIRLSESPRIYFFKKEVSRESQRKLVMKGYEDGILLLFTIEKDSITEVQIPESSVEKEYRNTYTPMEYLHLDLLVVNKVSETHFSSQMNAGFFEFLNHEYTNCKVLDLHAGCEARAGLISIYLKKKLRLESYKIFLSGSIKLRLKEMSYHWINHTLNIIRLECNGILDTYIFDPFMLDELMPLSTYLNLLNKCGSGTINSCIVKSNVFVCYPKYKLGLIDVNNQYAKTIFRTLYQ